MTSSCLSPRFSMSLAPARCAVQRASGRDLPSVAQLLPDPPAKTLHYPVSLLPDPSLRAPGCLKNSGQAFRTGQEHH